MKAFSNVLASILISIFTLYIPLCFSALSLNPFEWGHLERFIFAMFIYIGIGGYWLRYFYQKYIANQKLTV